MTGYGCFDMEVEMKDDKLQFGKKNVQTSAMASLITGSASLLMFVIFIFYRGFKLETPKIFAILATAALVVSLIGFMVSIKQVKKPNSNYVVPFVGVIVNGLAFMVYLVTYILGLL